MNRPDTNERRIRLASIAAGLGLAVAMLASPRAGAATTWLLSFTIDGAYADGVNVIADLAAPYEDYRLPTLPHPSPCVEAEPAANSHLHAVFNRKIDSAGTRCNPAGSDRQFRIRIDGIGACTRIFNAYGPTAVAVAPDGTCELYYNDNPRVRVASLFAKASRTPVAFLTAMFGNTTSYEIRTETDAFITSAGANQRVVTYMGTARLVEFGTGKTRAVEAPFNLKHKMTFTRYAQ
jgi:hypothetical protein